jgi:uncharacterized protein YqjF (DUF2071 family)
VALGFNAENVNYIAQSTHARGQKYLDIVPFEMQNMNKVQHKIPK